MIKQKKLKYKKNFDKRLHRKIHEIAVNRPQKKKKMLKSFLLTSIRDINRKSYWNRFWWNAVLFQKHLSGDVLKKCKKSAKFTGVKRRCWSLFIITFPAEEQQSYLKEAPVRIFFHGNGETFKSTFYRTHPGDCFYHSQNIFL